MNYEDEYVNDSFGKGAEKPFGELLVDVDLLKEKVLLDKNFIETFDRHAFPLDKLEPWLQHFNSYQKHLGKTHRTEKDFRQHFTNWVKDKDVHHPENFQVIKVQNSSVAGNTNGSPPQNFQLPKRPLTAVERRLNEHYALYVSGFLKVINIEQEEYEYLCGRKVFHFSEALKQTILENVQDYLVSEGLEKFAGDNNTVQKIAKQLSVIEHFKTLKEKGKKTVCE